jgi:tRNA pseudouridine38-40 synthase
VNCKIIIEYDGTAYCGWQFQTNGESIQAVIERAVSTFFGTPTRLYGSGRTDAGVHALGQVANFHFDGAANQHKIRRGLNALTPYDITIKEVEIVPDSFEARRDAKSRVYEYWILNRPTPSPFYRTRAWHLHDRLDIAAMNEASRVLLGEHDFSSFRAKSCDAAHAVRHIYRAEFAARGELLIYTIEATAFLRHMVRAIVGTLADVGRGLRTPQSFAELLAAEDRHQAGDTAPAHALYLLEVKYD